MYNIYMRQANSRMGDVNELHQTNNAEKQIKVKTMKMHFIVFVCYTVEFLFAAAQTELNACIHSLTRSLMH